MTIETSVDALTAQTSGLLEVCANLKNTAEQLVINAVTASENAAIIPLISMAANIIDTQALLVTYISRG